MIGATALVILWTLQSGTGQAAPEVIAHAADGARLAAPLLAIEADFTAKLGGKQPFTVAGGDLVSLRRVGVPQRTTCQPPYLQLTTGDQLPLAMPLQIHLDDETLRVGLAAPLAMANYSVPQAAVARLVLKSSEDHESSKSADEIVLKTGDRLVGKLGTIDPKKGAIISIGGEMDTIALERIARIGFNPEFQARPKSKGPFIDVLLTGGARLSLAKLATVGAGGQMNGVSLFGHPFTIAPGDLASLRVRGGKAVYLDELKPKSFESTPFLDVAWPLAVGRSVSGGPLKTGDDEYPLGLGMHSRGKATYALDAGSKWFEAIVAIDPTAGPRAAVKIDIELDGKPVAGIAQALKAGDPPAALRIDVRDAKTISLITDFGPRGDVRGHAVWADARIIRGDELR